MRVLVTKDVDGASGDVYYQEIAGLSTDTKPTVNVSTGSKFIAVDTGKKYVYDEDSGDWNEEPSVSEEISALNSALNVTAKIYNNVAAMLADTNLKSGDNVATRSYYSSGDNGGNSYVISATHTGVFYLTLSNGLYANLLTEEGVLRAESIGMKAYASETDNPDSNDMSRNVTLFNTAIYHGIYLLLGTGHFYFSSPVNLAHQNTFTIQGVSRESTVLHFPSSNGLYFSDPIYYNFYVIKGLAVNSYGHCIVCAEDCLTVLDSHFEWLYLKSEHGDGFHGPDYNLAKYVSQGGQRIVYDTCVQNAVFDFVNVEAHEGAGIANVMGMYSQYRHFNFIQCKYAFRNCDGALIQANTLAKTPGVYEDYFIYFDKTYSHSLKWSFTDVNAEGIGKAFIYTEPEVAVPEGEDPKKPETANLMTLAKLTAVNSGWSLTGSIESGHDVYPITVQRINQIDLINSDNIISPVAYPSKYDTTTVKGQLRILNAAMPQKYDGAPSINCIGTNYGIVYKLYGEKQRASLLQSEGHGEVGTDVPTSFDMIRSNRIYGGKATQIWNVKVSEYSSGALNPPIETYQFADVVSIENDTSSQKLVSSLFTNMGINTPGRSATIVNKSTSIGNIRLQTPQEGGYGTGIFNISVPIILEPNSCIQLISTIATINNTKYIAWQPYDLYYYDAQEINVSGATPTINGVKDKIYLCGEVTSLTINPPNDGVIEVFFTSGSTATDLTIPRSVKVPAGFDPKNLSTNTKYKIRITNAAYGEVETFGDQPLINLLDPSTFTDGKVWYNGAMQPGYNNNSATPKVAIEPGKTYILQRDPGGQGYVCWFDENEDYVSQESWGNGATKTIANGVYYVGISMAVTGKNDALLAEY